MAILVLYNGMNKKAVILISESEATPNFVNSVRKNFEVLVVPDKHFSALVADAKVLGCDIDKSDTDLGDYLKEVLDHVGDTDGC